MKPTTFCSLLIVCATILVSCTKEQQLIKDIEKGKWKLQSVYILDMNAGNTANLTETNVSGSIEFNKYDRKKEEGTAHLDIPVYPIGYITAGYSKTQMKSDTRYEVVYGNTVEKIYFGADGEWDLTIREYEKKRKLVLSATTGDDYYGNYIAYTFTKE